MATVPDPPTNLVATPGIRQITVAFTPGADGGSTITNYQYSLNSDSFIPMNPPVSTSPLIITNLYDNSPYTIVLQAINAIGVSQSSTTVTATTFSVPPAPTNLVSTPGNSQLTIAFTQTPAVGTPIINYQYSINGGNYVTLYPPSTQSPIVIRGLYNLTTYQVRLQSISLVGPSLDSASISAPTLYYARPPSNVTSTPGNGSITLSFTPGADGGSPILNYYYTINGGKSIPANPPVTSSPLTITGLTNNTTYRVTLQAYTAVGLSIQTLPLNSSTYSDIPPPTNLSYVGGIKQVSIYFTPSTTPYQIINYQYSLNGGDYVTPVPAVTASPLVIPNLLPGVTYKVQVRTLTTYAAGSTFSSIYASPISVPKPPVLLSYTPGNLSTSITFTLDTTTGSDITDVLYSLNGGPLVSTGTTVSPYTITGLSNNTTYSVKMAQQNISGTSPLSNPLLASTYSSAPAPTGLQYIAGDKQITITYSQPTVPNMAPILNYQYSTDNGATFFPFSPATGATLSVIIRYLSTNGTTPLSNNGVYNIKLLAVNITGNGQASAAITASTFTSPSPPTSLTAASSYTSVSIGFVPGNNGGLAITNYQYSIDNGASFTDRNPPSTNIPLIISGLAGSTTYQVKLKAVNSAGASAPSAAVSASTYYSPSAPTNLSSVSGDRQVSIYFTAGSSGSFAVTNYQYSINNGASYITRNPPSTANPIVINDLANGTVYQVRLKAVSSLGASAASAAVSASTYFQPDPPTNLSSRPGDKLVIISFTPGSSGSFPITNYQYSINNGASFVTFNPAQTGNSVTITGLVNGSTYNVKLKAVNSIGPSAASATVSASTNPLPPPAVPGAPTIVSVTATNTQTIVKFNLGSAGGAPITQYQYSQNGGPYTVCSPDLSVTPSVFTVNCLANGVTYNYTLRAINKLGAGTPSNSMGAYLPGTVGSATIANQLWAGNVQTATWNDSYTNLFQLPSTYGSMAITGFIGEFDGNDQGWGNRDSYFRFVVTNGVQGPPWPPKGQTQLIVYGAITWTLFPRGRAVISSSNPNITCPVVAPAGSFIAAHCSGPYPGDTCSLYGTRIASLNYNYNVSPTGPITTTYAFYNNNANIDGDPLGQPWWWGGGQYDRAPNLLSAFEYVKQNAPNAVCAYYFNNDPNVGTRINWYNSTTSTPQTGNQKIYYVPGNGIVVQFRPGLTPKPPAVTNTNYSLSNRTAEVRGALWKTWDIPVDCNITNIKFNVSGQLNANGWGLFYIWYVYNNVTTPLLPNNGFYPPRNGIPTGNNIQEVNIPLSRTPSTPEGLSSTAIKGGGKLNMYFSTLETYRPFITRVLNNGLTNELPFSVTYQPT